MEGRVNKYFVFLSDAIANRCPPPINSQVAKQFLFARPCRSQQDFRLNTKALGWSRAGKETKGPHHLQGKGLANSPKKC